MAPEHAHETTPEVVSEGERTFSTRRSAQVAEISRLTDRVRQLEHENESVQAFAAVAAHELLEPLIVAEAYIEGLSERLFETADEESVRDLSDLGIRARRLRLLVETILLDARSEGRPLRRDAVRLDVLVHDCLQLFAREVEDRDIRVVVGALPVVYGEEPLIASVYKNLLANALKYGHRKSGSITIAADRSGKDLVLFVEDDGPSIPAEDWIRIFEPYKRRRGERRAHGAGLGLAICRANVERHGGRIWVESGKSGGNRFSFTLE